MRRGRALVVALLVSGLVAQPGRQERRTVAQLGAMLQELWQTASSLPAARRDAVDAALAERPVGNPLGSLIAARACVDDVSADADYIVRRMVDVIALPEVVDPTVFEDEAGTVPYRLHVTLVSPFVLATDEPLACALELHAADGKAVWSDRITGKTAGDLAQLAVKLAIPVHDLPDGAYTVVARCDIGERVWKDGDPVARATVFVQRGFADATRGLEARVRSVLAEADRRTRAAVRGAFWPMQRVYGGDADEGYAAFLADQRNATRVLDNVAGGEVGRRAPLDGVEGFCSVVIEVDESDAPPLLRARVRPASAAPVREGEAAPGLVLFVPGDPSFDGVWLRPSLARATPPGFLASALEASGFDAARTFHVAVMESPGDLRDPLASIPPVLTVLTKLLAVDPARVVLVGEREGASAILAAWQGGKLAAAPRGLCLAVHAGIGRPDAERVAKTPLLLVPGRGHASAENLARAASQLADAGVGEQVQLLVARHAWPWALLHALPEIEAFCRVRLR